MNSKTEPFKINTSKINEQSRNKSLVDATGEQTLQLSSPELNFVNTEPNELYEISMNVRNVSQFSQKIRVKKPSCLALKVTTSREGYLAAGLDMKLTVVYDSKENVRISDRIVVATENSEIEIPVNVYPNVGKLEFEPFINFGFVKVGSTAVGEWNITNKAQNGVKIKLEPLLIDQTAKLELSCYELYLQAGEKKSVKLSLTSKVAGTVQGSVEIQPNSINYSTLEFVGNFCEFSRILSDAQGKEINQITLQPLFGGETMQTSAFLVNNSPEGCEYRITRKKGAGSDDAVSLITPEQIGKDDSEKLVQFKPSQGELEAYTSQEIKTTVMAKYEEADQQTFCNYILGKNGLSLFEREWTYTIRAHINSDEQHLDLPIKGSSMVPKLSLTPTYLQFSSTPLQSREKKFLKIQNFSQKEANIQFQNSANYTFQPQKLRLPEKGSMKVEVTFCPKKVGELNQICCLNLGVFSFPIKLFGKCVFGMKGDNQNSMCQEVPIDELDRSGLEEEISAIQKGKITPGLGMTDLSKNSIHFDSYRQTFNSLTQVEQKSLHFDTQKRTRMLRNKNGKEQKFDASHLNPNQPIEVYPSVAKNQQQQRLVSKQLTSFELRNISVGPVVIEIGNILLGSVQKKYFHIANFNQKPIAIRLQTSHDSFAETSEQRQILPAESHGGFPIVFEALSEGPFKHTLQYVLNGSHFFQLMVTGVCVLPSLGLSKNEVKFTIGEEDRKFEKKQILKLDNNFDYDVSYEWVPVANSMFVIEPLKGVVKPHSNVMTSFLYNFQAGAEPGQKIQETMKLKIAYGKSVEVKCSALIPESPCVCKAQEIQFKQVAIGRAYENKILIKNMSKVSTIYRVTIPKELEQYLSVPARTGSIAAEEMAEICFKLSSLKTMVIDSSIQIAIRGSKGIELPVKAKVILPQVRVEGQEIDFGSVPIEGNPGQRQVAIINDSNIPVELELRLHNETFLAKGLKLGSLLDNNISVVDTKQLKSYKVIHLRVNGKCRTVFTLQFYPEIADEYEFYLPLFIPNAEPMQELQKVCRCKGVKNRLMALNKEVSFGKIVIEQTEQIYSKSQVLEICNPQEEPITWWIDEQGLAPFRVDKKNGRMQGYQKCQIKIFFLAETPGEYSCDLKFFIDQTEIDISKCYMKVMVTATACYPTLYFQEPYLILPTVRCNEVSSAVLEIYNGGYQNINLKHTVIQQFSNIDLRVKYLNGSNLGVTRKQIKVEVSFMSEKPVSFTVKLSFFDNNGRTFTINVSGTADSHTYTIIDQQRNTSGWGASLQKSCQFLKYYINSTGHLADQLYEFPRSLMENQYQRFSQFLTNFSASFDKARSQVKKNAKTFFSFEYVSEVIKLLKAEGAFLNHIRPEMLLSYQEYLENIKIRAEDNAAILSYYKRKERSQFELEQKQSWVILFYQIFKVYSRVNPGKLKSNAEFWLKFQARQKALITWLQKTYLSESGIDLQSKGNELLSSISTCQLLSALISKYTNIKILECYGKNVKSQKEKEKRCRSVIETFGQIGINCLCRMEDLLRSNQKQMLLVLENLYMILPSYLQKGEPIVFSCQFGQVVTKSVEISNPSKHQLTYVAKIEGSKAFVIEGETEFIIESKKSHQVKIKYISNMNLTGSSATLTLTGKTNNKFTPSTFIFVLKSNNSGRISQKSVQVTGNLYEQLDFSLKVTNNFSEDGEFKIEVSPSSKAIYQAFYLPINVIKIKKGETVPLNMIFIPFMAESQQVFLIFKDEKVGEFQYELNGVVESNILCQEVLRVPQTLFTNKKYTIELAIPTKNDLVFRARKAAEYLADRLQKRGLPKDLKQPPVPINYYKYYPKLSNIQNFSAKLTTPNNSIVLKSEQLTIKDIDMGEDPTRKDEQKLVFEINLKSAIKEGSFTVNLKNTAGTDIRKYKVMLSAISKPLRYELEMKIPSNKALTQPLPLINLGSEKNIFHIGLIPANDLARSVFSIDCQRQMTVEPKEQSLINLSFKPRHPANYNALLRVENITSGQHVEYEIVGIGEQPETQTLNFQQQVRKEKTYAIKLPVGRLTRCVVQSFDLDQAQYQKNFQCSLDNPSFRFKLCPKMSGKIEGKLIIEAEQALLAYKIVVNVKNIIEGEIKLRTVERKEVSTCINLPNGQYKVLCQDQNVKYPKIFTVSEEHPTLQIGYYSSKPEEKEIMMTLISEHLGEMTYLLKVIVEPMPEIKLEPFQVQLGKVHREKVIFENTDGQQMNVSCKSSHPRIFYPQIQQFIVPPRSQFSNTIVYKASSLEIQEGKLYFVSDRSAKWTYHLSGYGLPQVKPQVRDITVSMGEHICQPITFRNPLNKTLQYNITLQNLQGGQAFSMILKSPKIDLEYDKQIEIPVTVKPTAVDLNKAILKIFVNEKISWKYELRAKTIFTSIEEPKTYKIACRQKTEIPIELALPFGERYNGQNIKLSIVNAGEPADGHLIRSAIKVANGKEAIVLSQKVGYTINVLSFKPKNVVTHFDICAENGCKWIYKMRFNFLPPAVDDQFEIATGINKPASVKFRLTNRMKTYAKFHAYFSSDSCIDFTVNPKAGELEPYGREGTPIEVVFCPTQYKKSWSGRLIIQTDESYWSYDVRGVLPHYSPPVGKSSLKQ